MTPTITEDIMDMTDDNMKRDLSIFLNEKKRAAGFTDEKLASDLGRDVKTVRRYMRMHLEGAELPKVIPDKTYFDLLTALQTSHAEFEQFLAGRISQTNQDSIANALAQSTGAGAMHIGSIQISGQTKLCKSPVASQTVNYNFDSTPRYDEEE